ncbi:hypothetical protein DH86_00003571 [Scytalidium sp. 3C]|nr:hypothetical protein DH86_00003571 [Scytalidium sp. 3C]
MEGKVRSLFFWSNASSKDKSFATYEYQLKAQAYETVAAGKQPHTGSNPVPGNGPVNLQRILRSGARGQSPVDMGRGHSADGPSMPQPRREEPQLRPKSARPSSKESSAPASPLWTPKFLRRKPKSNIESVTAKAPARPAPLPPSSPPPPTRILKAYEPTGSTNTRLPASAKSSRNDGRPASGTSHSDALETHWSTSSPPQQVPKHAASRTALYSHDEEVVEDDGTVVKDSTKTSDRGSLLDSLPTRPLSRSRSLRGSSGGDGATSGWMSSLSPTAPQLEVRRPVSAYGNYAYSPAPQNIERTVSHGPHEPAPPSHNEGEDTVEEENTEPGKSNPSYPSLRRRTGSIVTVTASATSQQGRQHIGSLQMSPRKTYPTPPSSPGKDQAAVSSMDTATELASAQTPPLSIKLETATPTESPNRDTAAKRSSADSATSQSTSETVGEKPSYSLQSKYSTGNLRSVLLEHVSKSASSAKVSADAPDGESSTTTGVTGTEVAAIQVPCKSKFVYNPVTLSTPC